MDYPKKLIFLHNFRCSGNVLNETFARYYANSSVKLGVFFKENISYEDLKQRAQSPKIKLVYGHNVYGLHKHIDSDCEYFTNLRHPRDRLISGFLAWNKEGGLRFSQWLEDHHEAHNGIVARFCGYGKKEGQWFNFLTEEYLDGPPKLGDAELERAANFLSEECGLFLLQEFQEEGLLLFEERYNCEPLINMKWTRFNQSFSFLKKNHFSSRDLKQLERQNALDIQLFEYAKKAMEDKLSAKQDEFHEKARIRKIFNSAFRDTGKHVLDNASLEARLSSALNQLYLYGFVDELPEFIELLFSQRNVDRGFKTAVYTAVKPVLDGPKLKKVQEMVVAC